MTLLKMLFPLAVYITNFKRNYTNVKNISIYYENYPIINYTKINLKCIHYITKINYITTPSMQSPVQGKDWVDLKELRFISSLSTFSRAIPHDCPPIAKSPLCSLSTGACRHGHRHRIVFKGISLFSVLLLLTVWKLLPNPPNNNRTNNKSTFMTHTYL